MNNKSEYLLLTKDIQTIINDLNDLDTNLKDLTKNFSKGLDGDNSSNEDLLKIMSDLKAIKDDLNNKVLPELKKNYN
jgi:predicted  nucleic acid-binding Zn-ribbon protein